MQMGAWKKRQQSEVTWAALERFVDGETSIWMSGWFSLFCSWSKTKGFRLEISYQDSDSKASVVIVWVVTPLGVEYQRSCISDIYMTIHNSSKITVLK